MNNFRSESLNRATSAFQYANEVNLLIKLCKSKFWIKSLAIAKRLKTFGVRKEESFFSKESLLMFLYATLSEGKLMAISLPR